MRPHFTLLFFLTTFLQFSIYGQVTVLGKFAIADPSNSHLLKTTRSDQFIGKVMSWTADSVVMVTNSNLRIAFTAQDVRSIEVVNKQTESALNPEIFLLQTVDGQVYYGYPRLIMKNRINFVTGSNGTKRLNPKKVVSIEPTTAMNLLLKEPYVNEYLLKRSLQRKTVSKMLGYSDGNLELEDKKGNKTEVPIKNITRYELYPQYAPYHGYGRSLFALPTGFGMDKGEIEYRNIYLGINIVSFGLTEHISLGAGSVSILPYADIKYAHDFGDYVHLSVGGYAFVPFAFGIHGSVSLGTPDYFLNISYLRNNDFESLYSDSDFESFGVGASMRVGRRSRAFAEFNIMTAPINSYRYDSFYYYGYNDMFSWGYTWFGRKYKFETGFMEIGPFESYSCFPNECQRRYHVPIPFFAFSYKIR